MAEPRPSDSFILRFEELAQATPRRPAVDVALRALDMLFSLLFLFLSLPLWLPLSLVIRIASGPPLFYRGERVGRGGRVFLNVLIGDMSLVGPRPIRPRFFQELAGELPVYWQRLVVRPGLTGFAQVRRGYETSMAEKLAHDLEWIADRSIRLYLRTLVATGWRVSSQSLGGVVRPRE